MVKFPGPGLGYEIQGTARIIEEFSLRLCQRQSSGQRQGCSRSNLSRMCPVCTPEEGPPPPYFSQVFILKGVKVLCFDTLLQVFILKVVSLSHRLTLSACKS